MDHHDQNAFNLADGELKAFIRLCACFVLLYKYKDFSDKEKEFRDFIDILLEIKDIDAETFSKTLDSIKHKDARKIAERQMWTLQFLSGEQKQKMLQILVEISKADDFFHANEKLFLEDVKKYWGLEVGLGKGELNWTKEQLEIIKADKDRRVVVNAMPGSGKTAVACAKISHLISNRDVAPHQIWLLSFTRTAVQELRDRIASFAKKDEDVIGVKIATIDSRAGSLRSGMTDKGSKNSSQGYDPAILETHQLLEDKREDFEQAFGGASHVIIDEAQDITSIRCQLIERIVNMLPPTCGVTIFGDEAQAIYGFTSDEEDGAGGQNYLDVLKRRYSKDFEFLQLTSMQRTENVRLLQGLVDLRRNIQVDSPEDAEEKISQFADASGLKIFWEPKNLHLLDNDTLILFRRRSDVLQAFGFASEANQEYRIRMSGLPVICRPWIAQILFSRTGAFGPGIGLYGELISLDNFYEAWQWENEYPQGDLFLDRGDSAFSGFKKLLSVANQDGKISIEKLRKAVSRPTPPVELCIPDVGAEGPILGTIHASKGREAEEVRLFISSSSKSDASDQEKAEETRVLFVGASRAKKRLSVGKSYNYGGKGLEGSGRSWKRTKEGKIQIEIGRRGDFDVDSLVNKKMVTDNEAIELQGMLPELISSGPKDVVAIRNDNAEYLYDLYVDREEIWIGRFNGELNDDLFEIKKCIGSYSYRGLPKEIPHLRMLALTTVAIPDNQNERTEAIVDIARKSGFWLAPIVMGYPAVKL